MKSTTKKWRQVRDAALVAQIGVLILSDPSGPKSAQVGGQSRTEPQDWCWRVEMLSKDVSCL